jgi:hypothetical protein
LKKIGVIDLETLQINNEGEQCVFAGGWAVKDFLFTEYLDKIKISNIIVKSQN